MENHYRSSQNYYRSLVTLENLFPPPPPKKKEKKVTVTVTVLKFG